MASFKGKKKPKPRPKPKRSIKQQLEELSTKELLAILKELQRRKGVPHGTLGTL